jgi:hypothetical protein
VNTDAELVARSDGAIIGRLLVSKGGVDWWPANAQKRHYTMTWEKFRDAMERDGKVA